MVLCKPELDQLTKILFGIFISFNFYSNSMETDNNTPHKKFQNLDNIFQYEVSQQTGGSCGYHALYNGLNLLKVLEDSSKYKLLTSNEDRAKYFGSKNSRWTKEIVKKRIKTLVKYYIADHLFKSLKNIEIISKHEDNAYKLNLSNNWVKLKQFSPDLQDLEEYRKKFINLIVDVSNNIANRIVISGEEKTTCKIYKRDFISVFKKLYKFQNFNKIYDIINLTWLNFEITSNNKIKNLNNPNEIYVINWQESDAKDRIQHYSENKEINLSHTQEGDWLSSEEIEHLINNLPKDFKDLDIFCLDLSESSDPLVIQEELKNLTSPDINQQLATKISNFKNKDYEGKTLFIISYPGHWISCVVYKYKNLPTNFIFVDSLNIDRTKCKRSIEFTNIFLDKTDSNLEISNDTTATKVISNVNFNIIKREEDPEWNKEDISMLKEETNDNIHEENDQTEKKSTSTNSVQVESNEKALFQATPKQIETLAKSFKREPQLDSNHLAGGLPIKISRFIKQIKEYPQEFKKGEKNIVLLGPPGAGKTTIAEIIAKELGKEFYSINAGKLITPLQGSASSALSMLFEYIDEQDKEAVIFIDELDAIVNKDVNDSNGESLRARSLLQSLVCETKSICIFATNYFDKFPEAMKSRLIKVSVDLPGTSNIFEFLKKEAYESGFKIDIQTLKGISKNFKEVNYRDLSRILKSAMSNARERQKQDNLTDKILLEKEDFLVAFLEEKDDTILSDFERKLLFKYYLLNEGLKLDFIKSILNDLSKETSGFNSKDIQNAVKNAKKILESRFEKELTLNDLYAGIYYDQDKTFPDTNMRMIILKHLMSNNPHYKITDPIYCDIANETIDNFTVKDFENLVNYADKLAQDRNFKVIYPYDLYLSLSNILKSKAKPYAVSIIDNTTYSLVNEGSISIGLSKTESAGVNLGAVNGSSSFTYSGSASKNFHSWTNHTTHQADLRELEDDKKFLKESSEGEISNKNTRLDYRTKKVPNYYLRFTFIKHCLQNKKHKMDKQQLIKLTNATDKLSLYTIKKILELSDEVYSLRILNELENKDNGLTLEDIVQGAKKINIDLVLKDDISSALDIKVTKILSLINFMSSNLRFDNDLLENIIKNIENINLKDNKNTTVLNKVKFINWFGLDLVKLLLTHKADPTLVDSSGRNVLMNILMIKNLDENKILDIMDIFSDSDLDVIINCKDNKNTTALIYAFDSGYIKVANKLISLGANMYSMNDMGKFGLSCACEQGCKEIIESYIHKAEPNINYRDCSGNNIFLYAAKSGNVELVKFLLDNQFSINFKNYSNQTALHFAALSGNIEVFKTLIDKKIDINAQDNSGQTALIDIINWNFSNKALSECKSKLKVLDFESNNDILQRFSKLHGRNSIDKADLKNILNIVELLISKGAKVDLKDKDGNTPLILAVKFNCVELVKILIKAKASIYVINNQRYTPRDIAIENKNTEIINLINSAIGSCILS